MRPAPAGGWHASGGPDLLAQDDGAGAIEARHPIRRPDRRVVEVSRLLYLLASFVDGPRRSVDIDISMAATSGRRMSGSDNNHLVADGCDPSASSTATLGTHPHASPLLSGAAVPEVEPPHSVLVIDDSPVIRTVSERALSMAGFRVRTAETGAVGLALLDEREHPEVVLLDVNMPEVDGWETLARIRANRGTTHLPVIMHTANRGRRQMLLAWILGCDGYLSKPVDRHALVAELRLVLHRSEAERQAVRRAQVTHLRSPLVSHPVPERPGAVLDGNLPYAEDAGRWCRRCRH